MGGMVHIAPGAAAFHTSRARNRIDANTFHAREVDYQAVVAGAQSGAVVSSTPNSQYQPVVARKVDRCNYVGHIHAVSNQRGALIDHSIVDLTSILIDSLPR